MASRKPKQMELIKKAPRAFGGSRLKSNPKTKRTLSTREPIHLILKSSFAVAENSLLHRRNHKRVKAIIENQAIKWGIQIEHLVNVGNHLHMVIKLGDRELFTPFIRAISGLIARHVLGASKGNPQVVRSPADLQKLSIEQGAVDFAKIVDHFWDARPFTRLISWGRDYKHINSYMQKNQRQASERLTKLTERFVAWGFDIIDLDHIKNLDSTLNTC